MIRGSSFKFLVQRFKMNENHVFVDKMEGDSCIFLPKVGDLVIHFLFLTEAYKQFNANTSFPVYSQSVCDVRRFWSSGDSTSKRVLDVWSLFI